MNHLKCKLDLSSGNTLQEKLEDINGVIKNRKSKDRQQNGKTKKDKKSKLCSQGTTHKAND